MLERILITSEPGNRKLCILHPPFVIAGDLQGFSLRVFAPQRFARCRSK
jgi:hypothetical protein